MNSVLGQRGYELSCREAAVVAGWPEIVGEKVAAQTRCTELRGGKVYVEVKSAAWRQELSCVREELLSILRRRTGQGDLVDIVFY